MHIAIFGTGYVGLVSGTCFAEMGIHVCCFDIDAEKIQGLQNGKLPIYEHGLQELLEENVDAGRLHFSSDISDAMQGADACFICVGTPMSESGEADLQYIEAVARSIGQQLQQQTVVVVKSTVPVGTCARVKAWVQEELDARGADIPFSMASNPEFLKEGVAVNDFMKPDRVVIGVEDEHAEKVLKDIYVPFIRMGMRIYVMDIASSEMTKYAANCFLATKISFINEIANICEHVGANVEDVRQAMGADKRIGHQFLFPGVGYGGSCFPKDIRALASLSSQQGYHPQILDAVDAVNQRQKQIVFKKIQRWCEFSNLQLDKLSVAIWGLSFKPDTDDIRESPGLILLQQLIKAGVQVHAHDPKAMDAAKAQISDGVVYHDDPYQAIADADILCVMTEWKQFRHPEAELIKKHLRELTIFDGRNIYGKAFAPEDGITVIGIGQ